MAKRTRTPGITTHTERGFNLRPFATAPVTACALFAGTALGHAHWQDSPTWPAVAVSLAGTGLTALAWRAGAPRGVIRRYLATGTVAAASLWTLGGLIHSPWASPWGDAWLIGAPVMTVAWWITRLMRSGDGEETTHSKDALRANVTALREAVLSKPKVSGAQVSQDFALPHGETADAVTHSRGEIASALDLPATAVRVVPNPDSVRKGTIIITPADQLKVPTPWPGLVGGSIADPITLGVMEDGQPLRIWLPGDHKAGRNASHAWIVGTSGAGKTELLLTLAAEVLARHDAELYFGDPRKGPQLPDWLRQGAGRVAVTTDDCVAMLESIAADVPKRAEWLGSRGFKQWEPACAKQGLRYRVVVIDEVAKIAKDISGEITDLTESCRSVGISLVFGLQRGTFDRFPTSARSNIALSICMGVKSEGDATGALSDETFDAGAAPWVWSSHKPGSCYAEIPGTDPARWSMPARAFLVDEQDRAAQVAPYLTSVKPAPTQRPADHPLDRLEREYGCDDVDPSAPIPPLRSGFSFPTRSPRMEPEQAYALLQQTLLDMLDAGNDVFRPGDMGDVLATTGYGDSWLRKQLVRLIGEGMLVKEPRHGHYRIRVSEPV